MAVIPIFNWIVDPLGVFHALRIDNFNAIKLAKETPKRETKTLQINSIKPEVIVLGTSRMLRGIDPDDMVLLPGKRYNFAVTNARLEETFAQLKYAHRLKPLKTVIIGLDFFVFNANNPSDVMFNDFLGKSILTQYTKILWSFDTLMLSKDVVMQKGKREAMYLKENGLLEVKPRHHRTGNMKNFTDVLSLYLDKKFFPGVECTYSFQNQNGQNTSAIFRDLVEFAHRNNITLVMIVPPDHAWMIESIYQAKLGPAYEAWLQNLVSINEEVATRLGKQAYQIWDFSGFNEITIEPVPVKQRAAMMQNYYDVAHFTPAVGKIMLDKMFGKPESHTAAKNFGNNLTTQSLAKHLAALRASRKSWRENHREEAQNISMIVATSQRSHATRCANGEAKIILP